MANAKCRNCDNNADASAYCSSCAAAIMAKAPNPYFGGKWKKDARKVPPPPVKPHPQQQLQQQRLFR